MSQKTLKIFITPILLLALAGGFFVFSNGKALAALGINKQINFQGKVVNTDGTNVADGNYNFTFSIYTVASGGANIWTESKSLAVTDGIFQTNLGSATPLPGSVDFNSDNIYLGINFNANGEMTPRVQFTATPYSFNSDSLDGKDWSAPGAIGSVTPNAAIFTSLGVVESGGSPIFHTFFQGGDQVADISYVLPAVAANGMLRNTGGTLSWDTLSYVVNPMSAVGDIIYGGVAGAPTRLAGSAGFLTSTGAAAPVWTAANSDYFTQYALLNGRVGGQKIIGGTAANNQMTIQGNSAASGNTGTNSNIAFKVGDNGGTTALSLLNNGNSDFNHNQAVNFRVENANGNVVTPTCDSVNQGRMYYDTGARSAFVCIESAPSVFSWFDYTATSVYSNKVVTVGTGGDYATIAAGAGYLSTLGGGIILLTPETHNVTSSVDLSNMNLIGANTGDTRINVTGAGRMRVKETQFKSMTIYVDGAMAANSAIDAKYSAATTTSVIFEWVDFITNGTKVLVNSSDATAPTVRTRFISTSTTAGTQKIFLPIASANLNAASTHFVESQGGSGTLDIEDWNVKIAGSSNVKTSGTIETIPDSTIFVYPGMNLQAAINSLSSGGVITLLPGVHNISSTLLINRDDIQIEGYGDASIIRALGFVGSDTTGAIQIGSVNGATPNDGIVLRDFRLEVSGTGASDIHGIRMAGGEDNQIMNITIVKTTGASGTAAGARMGMLIMDGTTERLVRPVIKGCRVLGTQSATAYFTDGIHVTGGTTYGAGSGIFTNGQGIEGALVDGNYVDYVRETVAVFVGVNNSSLFNNRFSRMGAGGGGAFGVFFGNSSNVNMTSNVVATSLSAASYALVIDSISSGSLKQVTDSVFTANAIDGSANGGVGFQYGVNIGNATNTAFHRNIFTNNIINGASNAATTAFTVTGNADDNNFSNNVFNGINNPWDTGINIANNTAERNFIGKNAFINTTVNIADAGTATQTGATQHSAASSPTVADDNTRGYNVGAIWVNTATQNAYMATSVATGAASWEQIDATGGAGVSTLQDSYTADVDGGNVNIVMTAADGSLVLQNTAGTQFAVTMGTATAPTLDLSNIINTGAGQGAATTGVDGMQIDFANGGALAMDNAGLRVNVSSNNNTAGTTLEGIAVGNITGQANATETALNIGTGWDVGVSIASGGMTISGGALAINNAAGITSNQATLNINASGIVNIQDTLNADSITTDTGGMSIAAGQSYSGAGAVDVSSAAGSILSINSGTTGTLSIGDDGSAETINIGTGAADKDVIIGSANIGSSTSIQSGTGGMNLQANGTATGNVQIGDGGAASATPDMLVLDAGSAEPAGTNGAMYYSTALNKMRCYENGTWKDCITSSPETAVFNDATPAAWTDTNTTELFNDATKPSMTTDSATATVLVNVQIYGQASNTAQDAFLAARIVRTTNGTNPSCASATNVGVPMIGGFTTNTQHPWQVVGTFIDSPGVAGDIRYTICTSTDSVGTATDTPNNVIVQLSELGADLAENYYTQDDSIEPGDVVAINADLSAGIQKSQKAYDQNVIGIISTNPGITLDDAIGLGEGGRPVAVALAGRIPVKVSMENGRVKAGDFLTASSVPGVAMKATKRGQVIGQALQDFNYADGVTGLVLTFVKNTYFDGEHISDDSGKDLSGAALLQKLMNDKIDDPDSQTLNEVATDRLAAGTEIVTPQLTVENIIAKNIKAEHIEGLEIMQTGISDAQDSASDSADAVKNLGQRISDMQKAVKSLGDRSSNFIASNLIEISDKVTFKSVVEFMKNVVFHKDVEFSGQVMFNQNSAGYALIKSGQNKVHVVFEQEYAVVPVVNASISLQQIKDDEVRKASEDLLLLSGAKFIVTNVTEKGFEIRIDQKTDSDIPFSWQAMAVKDVKTYQSEKKSDDNSKDDSIFTEDASAAKDDSVAQTLLSDRSVIAEVIGTSDGKTASDAAVATNDAGATQ